ncbi:hypothetical protein [Candidatus Coxiella mudrowiae]|uniref:hypothetical protein n=1 Tax=Candidatus Coxiella mudrowiae TaxID=2054173 RepID=UPI002467FD23|nr:hypothetical protein [Candidatus Coxiella mudrowiae]
MQLENRISEYLDVRKFIPAIGQVAISVECRKEDAQIHDLLKPLDDKKTQQYV